jgi:hypothetical protein
MSLVSIILFIVNNLGTLTTIVPNIVTLVNEILSVFHKLPVPAQLQAKASLTQAIQSGDHAQVGAVIQGLHTQLTSPAPVDLAKE